MKSKKQNSSQLSPTNESSQNGKLKPPSNQQNNRQVITPTTKKLLGTGLTIVESPMDDEDEQADKYKKFLQSQPILSNEMKLQIAIDIAEGMHHLHSRPKPIIHRDLKSHNVLLDKNLISKISDFGLSSVRNRNSGVSGMKGTSGWMAPVSIFALTFNINLLFKLCNKLLSNITYYIRNLKNRKCSVLQHLQEKKLTFTVSEWSCTS